MNQLLLIKLSEKVKNCNRKEVKDFGFDGEDFSNVDFECAWFEIHSMPYTENYNVTIRENGKVYLAQGDTNICQITGQDAKYWKQLANDMFRSRYEAEIEEASQENEYWTYSSHQDTLGELQRHGW